MGCRWRIGYACLDEVDQVSEHVMALRRFLREQG
jgi:hypothetical protein